MPGYPCCCIQPTGGIYDYYDSSFTALEQDNMVYSNAIYRKTTCPIKKYNSFEIIQNTTINNLDHFCERNFYEQDYDIISDSWLARFVSIDESSGTMMMQDNAIYRTTNKLDSERVWIIQSSNYGDSDYTVNRSYYGPETLLEEVTGLVLEPLTGYPTGSPLTTYNATQEVFVTGTGDPGSYYIYYNDSLTTGDAPFFPSNGIRLLSSNDSTIHDNSSISFGDSILLRFTAKIKPQEARVFDFGFYVPADISSYDTTQAFSLWFQDIDSYPIRINSTSNEIYDWNVFEDSSGYYRVVINTTTTVEDYQPVFTMRIRSSPEWAYYSGPSGGGAYIKDVKLEAWEAAWDSLNNTPLNHTITLLDTTNLTRNITGIPETLNGVITRNIIPTGAFMPALGYPFYSQYDIKHYDSEFSYGRFVVLDSDYFFSTLTSYNGSPPLYGGEIEHYYLQSGDGSYVIHNSGFLYGHPSRIQFPSRYGAAGGSYKYSDATFIDKALTLFDTADDWLDEIPTNGMLLGYDETGILTYPFNEVDIYMGKPSLTLETLTNTTGADTFDNLTLYIDKNTATYLGTVPAYAPSARKNRVGQKLIYWDYNTDHYACIYPSGVTYYVLNIDNSFQVIDLQSVTHLSVTKNGVLVDSDTPQTLRLYDFTGGVLWNISGNGQSNYMAHSDTKVYFNKQYTAHNVDQNRGYLLNSGNWTTSWKIDYDDTGTRQIISMRDGRVGDEHELSSLTSTNEFGFYNKVNNFVYNNSLVSEAPVKEDYTRYEYKRLADQHMEYYTGLIISGADSLYRDQTSHMKLELSADSSGTADCFIEYTGNLSIMTGSTYVLRTDFKMFPETIPIDVDPIMVIDIINCKDLVGDPIRFVIDYNDYDNHLNVCSDTPVYSGLDFDSITEFYPFYDALEVTNQIEFTIGTITGLPSIRYTMVSDYDLFQISGYFGDSAYVEFRRIEFFEKAVSNTNLPFTDYLN